MKEPRGPRRRARQACLACNARRVKCNVTESMPCRNCEIADVACEIRESRRGKHVRPSKRHTAKGSISLDAASLHESPENNINSDHVEASHTLASLAQPNQSLNWNETPFEDKQAPRHDQRREDDEPLFMGESSAVSHMPGDSKPYSHKGPHTEPTRLRHSIPNAVKAEAMIPQWEADRRKSRINYLRSEGAFTVPAQPVLEALMGAYFRWFHPIFAIVDEQDVREQQKNGTLSPLLLQALLFVGVLHCEESQLKELGLGHKQRAKYIYYNRAKDIYDADYESRKLTVIQALFLMSFFRAGALLEKDVRHWLGAAINIAQARGFHRSAGPGSSQVAKVRKRLWWSLYVRERQASAGLGLPHRIRDEDCDLEPLEPSDFDLAFGPQASASEKNEWIAFAMGMCGLARTLGIVVHSGYLPHKHMNAPLTARLKDDLIKWKQNLPAVMQLDNDFGDKPGFHANLLHLAYNNLLILLYRSDYIEAKNGQGDADSSVALQAASRNARIVEDMLPSGVLVHGHLHLITNIFNTLCIHTLSLQRSEGTARAIAEHRAKLCLMGLKELQKTWEVSNWILALFFQYLDRSTAARLQINGEDMPSPQAERTRFSTRRNSPALDALGGIASPIDIGDMSGGRTSDGLDTAMATMDTPWSWSTEEANNYLFSQIENDFSFGEGGGMFDWVSEDALSSMLPTFDGT